MRLRFLFIPFLLLLSMSTVAPAQTGEVTVSLNESFFDALLDAVFKDGNTLKFSEVTGESSVTRDCDESVKLHREVKGRRTSVSLRNGKIFAPVAFTGAYAAPLVGCLEYSGVAESEIALEFDSGKQSLVGRVKVTNVVVNGTGGVGGTVVAKFVQRSIDEKINPLQILGLDRISLSVPVQGAGEISLKAVAIEHRIADGSMVVKVTYEMTRG